VPDQKLIIRDARLNELDEVSQILKRAYSQYADFLPDPDWKNYLEDIIDVRSRLPEVELIVAEIGGCLAGTVTLYLKYATPPVEGWLPGWAGIRLLAVDPYYRGRGIGRDLMDECIRRCRKQGIKTIALHTSEIMGVAKRMYEKMGFKRIPEYDFHPRPEVVVMAYRLDL
jgi:ribosomal protein S18 acetylase RimI-like enzyme